MIVVQFFDNNSFHAIKQKTHIIDYMKLLVKCFSQLNNRVISQFLKSYYNFKLVFIAVKNKVLTQSLLKLIGYFNWFMVTFCYLALFWNIYIYTIHIPLCVHLLHFILLSNDSIVRPYNGTNNRIAFINWKLLAKILTMVLS